jgi:uncharacterized protein YbaP (TraB family)
VRTLLVVSLAIAIALAGCAAKQHCEIETPHGPAQPFLWKAQGKSGDIVWLYGTIHDAGLDAVPKVALDALDRSARLITELGDVDPDPDMFRDHARIKSGPGIDQLLPSDDWYDLRDTLVGAKIKEDDLRRARPWYAMSLLTTHLAPSPGPSMDVELAKRAHGTDKPVDYLETWQDQLAALDGAVGIRDLQEAIHARKTMKCELDRLVTAYRAGDVATMQALLVIPRTKDTLLTARNQKWFPQIEQQLAKGGAFVAVGLGHMLGEQGLVAMLQRAGYTVERMPAAAASR